MSTASSSAADDLCHCKLPPRICTSKTKDNPGKKFRVCPNSLVSMRLSVSPICDKLSNFLTSVSILVSILKKPGKKCDYWEWVEEGSAVKTHLEDEIATIKEEVLALKKEVAELRKTARSKRVKISCNLL
ncbi:hypothetical protein LXL04_019581 [Taraxacum kok-saghyz]